MSNRIENFSLTPAKKLLEHLQQFTINFYCPCCGLQAWALHVMSIHPDLVDNFDGTKADLDVVTPRFISGTDIPGINMPEPMVALPVTCQHCGYIAFFDATIVNRGLEDERS